MRKARFKETEIVRVLKEVEGGLQQFTLKFPALRAQPIAQFDDDLIGERILPRFLEKIGKLL